MREILFVVLSILSQSYLLRTYKLIPNSGQASDIELKYAIMFIEGCPLYCILKFCLWFVNFIEKHKSAKFSSGQASDEVSVPVMYRLASWAAATIYGRVLDCSAMVLFILLF